MDPKKGLLLFFIILVIFGIPYTGIQIIKSITDLNIDNFASNAGVVIILSLGGWYAFQTMRENLYDRRSRRFRNSYDIRTTPAGTIIISDNINIHTAFYQNKFKSQAIQASDIEINEISKPLSPLIPFIRDELSIGLIGSQGTGKTTLFTNLLKERSEKDIVYVVDPHGHDGKYPSELQTVGIGRNYQEIDDFLEWSLKEMSERYKKYPSEFEQMTIGIDELTLLHSKCKNISDFMQSALTEFRKVGMKLIFCCHSRRAKYLNLQGGYDLTDGIVFVDLKNQNGNRSAEITRNGVTDQTKYALPLPCHGHVTSCHDNDLNGHGVTGGHDRRIFEMFREGYSLSKISKEIYGIKNGKSVQKIKDILGLNDNKID